MNYTLFDLFLNAYNGNSFAQLQIVQRFQPLLKKYAALLKYEDAYSDLQLYLLELLHSGKLTKLQRKDDGTLVKYIESSIRHQYISLNSRKNAVDNSVIASVDEIDFDQMSLSSNDEYPELLISDLHSVLQPSELTLLSQFVFKGMSIADTSCRTSSPPAGQREVRPATCWRSGWWESLRYQAPCSASDCSPSRQSLCCWCSS